MDVPFLSMVSPSAPSFRAPSESSFSAPRKCEMLQRRDTSDFVIEKKVSFLVLSMNSSFYPSDLPFFVWYLDESGNQEREKPVPRQPPLFRARRGDQHGVPRRQRWCFRKM